MDDQKTPNDAPFSTSSESRLARAFDHCPLALFAFLSDADAASVACALCAPHFLSSKRYDLKSPVPFYRAVAGLYSGVVRHVCLDGRQDGSDLAHLLPSMVVSLSIENIPTASPWRVRHLPASLTSLIVTTEHILFSARLCDDVKSAADWPASLTHLELPDCDFAALPPLPPSLRVFKLQQLDFPDGALPRSLTSLTTQVCNRPLFELPPHLTSLSIHIPPPNMFSCFPDSLTSLAILNGWEIPTEVTGLTRLPEGLRVLRADSLKDFDCEDFKFPDSLLELGVPYGYVSLVSHASLQKLSLSSSYSYPITAVALPHLRSLSLGADYDLPLNDLPPSLSELTLLFAPGARAYSHRLDHLPASLAQLTIGRPYEHELNELPSFLRSLTFKWEYNQRLDHLPESLRELSLWHGFGQPLDRLPSRLQLLQVTFQTGQPLDALPISLTELDLQFAEDFNKPLNNLPPSLKKLKLPSSFAQPLFCLPTSLTLLSFEECSQYDHPLGHLPDSLYRLQLGDSFNQPLRRLPRGLVHLEFSRASRFNQPLPLAPTVATSSCSGHDGKLPESKAHRSQISYPLCLRSLTLGEAFDQPLVLPSSLTKLHLPSSGQFLHPLTVASLPEKLTYLHLPKTYITELYPEFSDLPTIRQRCPFVFLAHL